MYEIDLQSRNFFVSEQAYFLPCYWNYRIRSQCFVCRNAETTGAALLHAGTNSFITGRKDLQFKAVFSAFKQVSKTHNPLKIPEVAEN